MSTPTTRFLLFKGVGWGAMYVFACPLGRVVLSVLYMSEFVPVLVDLKMLGAYRGSNVTRGTRLVFFPSVKQ